MTIRRWFTALVAMAVTVAVPCIVLAQTAAPVPVLKRVPAAWIGYLLMAVLIGAVLAVSLMPSKRSHQD